MIFPGDTKPRLTGAEIADRLKRFNETYDWDVFKDVPESQQIDVLYPHEFRPPAADGQRSICDSRATRIPAVELSADLDLK